MCAPLIKDLTNFDNLSNHKNLNLLIAITSYRNITIFCLSKPYRTWSTLAHHSVCDRRSHDLGYDMRTSCDCEETTLKQKPESENQGLRILLGDLPKVLQGSY